MRRMTVAVVTAAALAISAAPASADPGGVPDDNAGFGQGTSFGSSQLGLTPRVRADLFFGGSVQDTQSVTRVQFGKPAGGRP